MVTDRFCGEIRDAGAGIPPLEAMRGWTVGRLISRKASG